MAVVTTNLGVVTAYGYAKQKGYSGTEAEFAQLLADYADVAELTENIPDIIASEYSPSSDYAVGKYCLHDSLLYICTTAIGTSGESWNPNHWRLSNVGDALASCVTCTDENSDGNIVFSIGTT